MRANVGAANLHIICGNCGSNDMLSYYIDPNGQTFDGKEYPAVDIVCGNCSTIHDLSDTINNQDDYVELDKKFYQFKQQKEQISIIRRISDRLLDMVQHLHDEADRLEKSIKE